MNMIVQTVGLFLVLCVASGCGKEDAIETSNRDRLSEEGRQILESIASFDAELDRGSLSAYDLKVRSMLPLLTNKTERSVVMCAYKRKMLSFDVFGGYEGKEAVDLIARRCDAMRNVVHDFHDTIKTMGNDMDCLAFDLEMYVRLQAQIDQAKRRVADRQRCSPGNGWNTGLALDSSLLVPTLEDVRDRWKCQCLDAPKVFYRICFKGLSREEKKRYFDMIKSVVGHYPRDVVKNGKLELWD